MDHKKFHKEHQHVSWMSHLVDIYRLACCLDAQERNMLPYHLSCAEFSSLMFSKVWLSTQLTDWRKYPYPDLFDIFGTFDDYGGAYKYICEQVFALRIIFSKKQRFTIFERDNYRCVICGRSSKDGVVLEIDHIIPKSKGGIAVISNGATLCRDCNRGKSAHLLKKNYLEVNDVKTQE